MEEATLAGIPGTGVARSHGTGGALRSFSGTFAFAREHWSAVLQLFNSGDLLEFEGQVDGKRQRLEVMITRIGDDGVAHLEGSGSPYGTNS